MLHTALPFVAARSSAFIATVCSDVSSPDWHVANAAALRSISVGGRGAGGAAAVPGVRGGGVRGAGLSGVPLLPTTRPAPGVLMRESFGPGSGAARLAGGKGLLNANQTGEASINGFRLEYLGASKTQSLASGTGQTITFCRSENPHKLPLPLQAPLGGCMSSTWFQPLTSYPTALAQIVVPLSAAGCELSVDALSAPIPGRYTAIGFANSNTLRSSLTTSCALWLRATVTPATGFYVHYELRTGTIATGEILSSGDVQFFDAWLTTSLRYSPASGWVTLTIAGNTLGTFPVAIATPKYLAVEGIGVFDKMILRR